MKLVPIAALSLLLASCAPAQMRLPAGLSEGATRIAFTGMNGPTRGDYVAGPYRGRFDNSRSRSGLFLADRQRQAWTNFTIAGGDIAAPIAADCEVFSRSIDLGNTEITTVPVTYGCTFERDGQPLSAHFELQEVVGGGTAAYREERAGEIALDGPPVRFHSVHIIEGTGMPTITPVGYVFELGGQTLAALDLSGDPVLTMRPAVEPATARAIAVAAVALAIFREPDDS